MDFTYNTGQVFEVHVHIFAYGKEEARAANRLFAIYISICMYYLLRYEYQGMYGNEVACEEKQALCHLHTLGTLVCKSLPAFLMNKITCTSGRGASFMRRLVKSEGSSLLLYVALSMNPTIRNTYILIQSSSYASV